MSTMKAWFWLIPFTIIDAPVVFAQTAPETHPARVPAAILSPTQRVGRLLGVDLSGKPSSVSLRVSRDTGSALWRMSWREQDIIIEFDATRGKVVRVSNRKSDESNKAAEKAGLTESVTKEQAIAAVQRLSQSMGVLVGNWRVSQVGRHEPAFKGDFKRWQVRLTRYVNGRPVLSSGVYAVVNPYDGTVPFWSVSYEDYVFNRTPVLISEEQAKQIAVAAFRQCGGPQNVEPLSGFNSSVGGFGWVKIAPGSSLYRLAHHFVFNIKNVVDTLNMGVEVVVDAETGELWRIESITEGHGAGLKLSSAKPSARIKLAAALLADKHFAPLGHALSEGSLMEKAKPTHGESFSYKLGGNNLEFQLRSDQKELVWREESTGAWSGVHLSAKGLSLVENWLKARALGQ